MKQGTAGHRGVELRPGRGRHYRHPGPAGSRAILREWFGSIDNFDLAGADHQIQVMDAAGVAGALMDYFGKHPL